MRNRLIELINRAKQLYKEDMAFDTIDGAKMPTETDYIIDYLLANSVICPPCKVGDKVYKITRNKVKECEVVFVGISADKRCSYFNFVENYADGTFYKSYSMVFDVIGKSIFRTKEEAEKALKGGYDMSVLQNKPKFFCKTHEEYIEHTTRCARCIHSKGIEKGYVYCYNSYKNNYPYAIDNSVDCKEFKERKGGAE